jgi:hypothetical protein
MRPLGVIVSKMLGAKMIQVVCPEPYLDLRRALCAL